MSEKQPKSLKEKASDFPILGWFFSIVMNALEELNIYKKHK